MARYPMTLPRHDQSVAGPMVRDAEDCALMLDAMTGLSLKSPLSVPPTWSSAYDVEQNHPFEIAGRKLETYIDWVAQTFLGTLAALPAAGVPAGLASGVPVGLQIVGPRLSEPRILGCAKLVERDHPLGWAPLAVQRRRARPRHAVRPTRETAKAMKPSIAVIVQHPAHRFGQRDRVVLKERCPGTEEGR